MTTLFLGQIESGKIFSRKPQPNISNGLLVNIAHQTTSISGISSKCVRFLHCAFDVSGERFIAGDQHGQIYLFNLTKNKYSLVQRIGCAVTALSFSLRNKNEYLVALADNSLKCFDSATKELVSWMKGHNSTIHLISVHSSGRHALTVSDDIAQLWDIDTFQRKRKLNVKENVAILKVFFLPNSNTIMTCFRDDTIFAWDAETLSCTYQLFPPSAKSKPAYRSFAVSDDCLYLVGGGNSKFLHIWSLDTQKLHRIVQLPNSVKFVRQVEFLQENFSDSSNQVVAVLTQDGRILAINIHTYIQLFTISCGDFCNRINSFAVSNTGKYIVCVNDDGSLSVYNLASLHADLTKPPDTLVKVIQTSKWMQFGNESSESASKISSSLSSKRRERGFGDRPSQKSIKSMSSVTDVLDTERLMPILRGFGEYPEKYRMFIWRCLLQIPENHEAFSALVDKGTHSAYLRLNEEYPIKSRKLLRIMQRTLSALAHWAPIFAETKFLPKLVFPFVKLFQNNQLICFEVIATVLINWCQHWFEFFPNPPVNILGMIENVLAHHDKSLLQHFLHYGITTQMYAWPLLENLFSEVFSKDEWLVAFDNIFSNSPGFLFYLVVAYLTISRGPLLQLTQVEDFTFFFYRQNATGIKRVVKEAYRIQNCTPENIAINSFLAPFEPLTRDQYPAFNNYPKYVVDYQAQERERIREEELEYIRQRQIADDLKKEISKKVAEEEAFYVQQEKLLDAEEQRRRILKEEEKKLNDQRLRLQAMQREVLMREQQLLEAAHRRKLHQKTVLKEAELGRLDDEIERKIRSREMETITALEQVDLKQMQLKTQHHWLEQEEERENDPIKCGTGFVPSGFEDLVKTVKQNKDNSAAKTHHLKVDLNRNREKLDAEEKNMMTKVWQLRSQIASKNSSKSSAKSFISQFDDGVDTVPVKLNSVCSQ